MHQAYRPTSTALRCAFAAAALALAVSTAAFIDTLFSHPWRDVAQAAAPAPATAAARGASPLRHPPCTATQALAAPASLGA
jgi:hypothetical protein